jgi:hypothetical protein
MEQQSAVIRIIADAYSITDQQSEMLSNFSNAALEYAVNELSKRKGGVNSPVNWIASVARSFETKSNGSETGKWKPFNKAYMAKNHSPYPTGRNDNHSPAPMQTEMTPEERKLFLQGEISNYEKIIASPSEYLLKKVDLPTAVYFMRAQLDRCQNELRELLGDTHIVMDKDLEEFTHEQAIAMSPIVWLVENKKRKTLNANR